MRVVIAGAGAVGSQLARDLADAGHEVLVLEQDEATVAAAADVAGVTWRVADACEATALRAAELDRADVVVAATGDDEDNLVVSLLAKQEFGVPKVLARVNHPSNSWLFDPTWGVDVAVSTPALVTALVEEAISEGRMVELMPFEGGRHRLVEVRLGDDATAAGRTLAELDLPEGAAVVAVLRGGELVTATPETTVAPGDELLALVTGDESGTVRRILEATDDAADT